MGIGKLSVLFAAILGFAVGGIATPASAQATRTWVSGVGDDANPCSRTAPCKTFAGAISKTAAGGEIDCLDPGGFGTLTITKSITIDCTGTLGSILASGTVGININDSATATPNTITVVLRGLSINGSTGGTHGINFIAGRSLVVEDVIIQDFTTAGIQFRPAVAAFLNVHHTVIANSTTGILVQPTGSGSGRVSLEQVHLYQNTSNGLQVNTTGNVDVVNGILVAVENSEFKGGGGGVNVTVPAGTSAVSLMLSHSSVSNNTGTGLSASGSANGTMRVADSIITNNNIGVSATGGASVGTFGNNQLNNNATNGVFTGSILPSS